MRAFLWPAIVWVVLAADTISPPPAPDDPEHIMHDIAMPDPSSEPGGPTEPEIRIPEPTVDLTPQGELAVYKGDDLYNYVDGAAPLYMEYGFVELASQELLLRGRTYVYDIYRMADPLAAYGLWSVRRPAHPDPIENLPNSSFAAYQGMAAVGPYLIEIAAYETDAVTEQEMSELVHASATRLNRDLTKPDPALEPILSRLPASDRMANSLRVARGPIGLRAALGARAGGPFFDLVQAVRRSIAEPSVATGRDGQLIWLSGDFLPSGSDSTATTTLVVVLNPVPEGLESRDDVFARLLTSTQDALPAGQTFTPISGGQGWISGGSSGTLCAVRSGNDLLLGISPLEQQDFSRWLLDVLAQRSAELQKGKQ